jgi:signal transduction histidine kinase
MGHPGQRESQATMSTKMQEAGKFFAEASSESDTYFAPAERASPDQVEESLKALSAEPFLKAVLDTLGASLMVLNPQRQILVASKELLREFDLAQPEALLGFRPGEALNCIHAFDGPTGCGTSEACSTCGAVTAILQSQESGTTIEHECLMRTRRGESEEARELRIKASPMQIRGQTYTLISLTDISQEKRRETLEKVFFHDILNTIAGLHGWSRVLEQGGPEKREVAAQRICFLTERLYREIEDQRALLMAERGTLQVFPALVQPESILETVEGIFASHEASRGKRIEVIKNPPGEPIHTDDSMVVRVLANMIKNALEATPAGGEVRLWADNQGNFCKFFVWNAGVIPKQIALQIFRRSFSTKARKGRGIGTFSMKLFGERYLGGKVRFDSAESEGTIFSLTLPRLNPIQTAAPGIETDADVM